MFSLQTLFNVPEVSNVVIHLNGKLYYLISHVLKHHSPFFGEILGDTDSSLLQLSCDDPNIRMYVTKKKVIQFDLFELDSESVIQLLRYMYGDKLTISTDNAHHFLKIGQKFQMNSIIDACYKCIESNMKTETLIDDYKYVLSTNNTLIPIFHRKFLSSISVLDKQKVLELTAGFTHETIIELLKNVSCHEDYKFDIALHYCQNNSGCQKEEIMLLINLPMMTKEKLINEAKDHVNIEKYCFALECHVDRTKMMAVIKKSNKHIFAIGKRDGKYNGYRTVTNQDFNDSFIEKIKFSHQMCGRFHCLEDMQYFNKIAICTDNGHAIMIDGYFVRIKDIENNAASLCTHNGDITSDMLDKLQTSKYPEKTGIVLFVTTEL